MIIMIIIIIVCRVLETKCLAVAIATFDVTHTSVQHFSTTLEACRCVILAVKASGLGFVRRVDRKYCGRRKDQNGKREDEDE